MFGLSNQRLELQLTEMGRLQEREVVGWGVGRSGLQFNKFERQSCDVEYTVGYRNLRFEREG